MNIGVNGALPDSALSSNFATAGGVAVGASVGASVGTEDVAVGPSDVGEIVDAEGEDWDWPGPEAESPPQATASIPRITTMAIIEERHGMDFILIIECPI